MHTEIAIFVVKNASVASFATHDAGVSNQFPRSTCDVMAATIMSFRLLLNQSEEMTAAGHRLDDVRPVNAKGSKATSPHLKVIINGILCVVPESEGKFCQLQQVLVSGRSGREAIEQFRSIRQELAFLVEAERPDGIFHILQVRSDV